ncbi:hypothetical protein, partial [Collimonas pratensis]|uniref:hypothetical protein n=1 Tax=Collimonas pratensis TaxID=279113 RepID=UPI0019812988
NVRRVFSVDLPIQALFEAPTIGSLAKWINESCHQQTDVDKNLETQIMQSLESMSAEELYAMLAEKTRSATDN